MMKIKKPVLCIIAACVLMGSAAGAVVERVSEGSRSRAVRVVVDAGHGALGLCFKWTGVTADFYGKK